MVEVDCEAVAQIDAMGSSRPWSADLFAGELTQAVPHHYVVAVASGTVDSGAGHSGAGDSGTVDSGAVASGAVVGYAGSIVMVDDLHITNIAVDPAFRRRGIASDLMSSVIAYARDAEVTGVTLEVRASNEAALALYRRFGFAPEGVRKGYYHDPTEDALLLWLRDLDRPIEWTRE